MFTLLSEDGVITWTDGHLEGYPERLLDEAENALGQLAHEGYAAATPTGPFHPAASPEAALLTLRALWPQASLLGTPPLIAVQPDEVNDG
jgi:hypothetical protein